MSSRRASVIRDTANARLDTAVDGGVIAPFDPAVSAALADPVRTASNNYDAAFQQGYNDGLEQARADIETATNDANARTRRALSALREAVEQFDNRQAVTVEQVENEIVTGALALAKAVLGREVQVAVDPGAEAVARALALVATRDPALVRLNPHDATTLNLASVDTAGRQIEVIADPSVESGGAIIEVGNTVIDAQLSSAIAKAAKAMGTSVPQQT